MATRSRTANHMRTFIADTEEFLKETAGQVGDKIQTIRANIEETLSDAKDKILELEHDAVKKMKKGARMADKFVHKNPWSSIGIAAATGLILGLIIRRR